MINSFYMLAFLIGCLVGVALLFGLLLVLTFGSGGDDE